MKLNVDDVIQFPHQMVYEVQRDKMADLVNYLPNIASIDVLEREDVDGGVRILNLWRAAETEVPKMVRRFVKPDMLKWHDHAVWHDAQCKCDWRLEMFFFKEHIKVRSGFFQQRIEVTVVPYRPNQDPNEQTLSGSNYIYDPNNERSLGSSRYSQAGSSRRHGGGMTNAL